MTKYSLLLIALLAAGCSKFDVSDVSNRVPAEKQAPIAVAKSFSRVSCQVGSCIRLQKSSLGKLFLLIASGKTSGPTPQWLDVKPQVVSFEASMGRLALMQENFDTVYDEIKLKNLLQTFQILSEDADSLTFAWGKGLDSLIMESVFDIDIPRSISADGEDAENDDDAARPVIPVLDSFVRSVDFDTQNMHINQVSKVRSTQAKKSGAKTSLEVREETVDMDLQIRAYVSNPDFKSKNADPERRVGFFVSKLHTKAMSTQDRNLITHWDLDPKRGPVNVLISDAFPEEYVQAAVEAALYWNKVFGREVVAVRTHVDRNSTPQDRSIMVRWIPWMDAGAAYAQAQTDPLTGEILRGQVFMPSVFTRIGSAEMVTLNGDKPVQKNPLLNHGQICDFTPAVNSLILLSREASDSQRLRLAQDSVRTTVAHELGHAFGLRHNFAGSFSAKVSTAQIAASARTYLSDLQHAGLETTTSIMDYVSGVDDVLSSAWIKHAPLSYDQMAMTWAYAENDQALSDQVSLFCTDEDVDVTAKKGAVVYGCERFDAGNNPFQRRYLDALTQKNIFAKTMFTAIVNRVYPSDEPDKQISLAKVFKDMTPLGALSMKALASAGQIVMDSTKDGKAQKRVISITNAKSHLGKDPAAQDEEVTARIKADVARAGGYAGVMQSLLLDPQGQADSSWYESQVEDLAGQAYLARGRTLGGRDYEFTADQQKQIVDFLNSLTAVNKKVVVKAAAAMIPNDVGSEKNLLKENLLQENEEVSLADVAGRWILRSEKNRRVQVGPGLNQGFDLPERVLSADERGAMLGLISPAHLRIDASRSQAARVREAIKTQIDALVLAADPSAPVRDANPEAYKTILQSLRTRSLVDKAAAEWLDAEIAFFARI